MICMMHDFNPRTREGCDVDRVHKYLLAHRISIHAPVKGATFWARSELDGIGRISIHAPVKGATTQRILPRCKKGYFNPRTREGCDPELAEPAVIAGLISIHAPVKGATV